MMGTLRIISRSDRPFKDRREAGQLLAGELSSLRGQKAVVLGIPRGGVVVARELAAVLDADLDVVLARKLRSPGRSELAMGSVSEDGKLFLNEMVVQELAVDEAFIEQERKAQLAEIARRSEMIRRVAPKVPLAGRVVVVTDDGVATGATTQAAIWAVRQERPARLIAAFPVAPQDTLSRLAEEVDEVVCLRSPPMFYAVGQFYLRFEPLDDEVLLDILKEERSRKVKR
ncbi:MAG: phosphoribosyltransferase family protein [Dehalococcoidia bacterium]|nr:phosphoribosyltransferase family protein [Dehalococcoidia bacterium]